ncbi:MAG TPA: hypothetical protein VMZ31_08760 [Phycisphaerae bacterium]|nr:hypothetical protein [Phycisphaerae bacterium]
MKTTIRVVVTGALCLVVGLPPAVRGEPMGTAFTYQGRLKQGGVAFDGLADLAFSLWDDPNSVDPNSQVGLTQDVFDQPVDDGLFTVPVNAGGQFGPSAFDGQARWLQIAVTVDEGGPVTLWPRQPLTPTPYAVYAGGSPWGGLYDVPAGFADDTDDDTTYAAGTGLLLDTETFSLDPNYMLPQGCQTGQVAKWDPYGGGWTCADDETGLASAWLLAGNGGTDPNSDFLGTTDATPLELRVDNVRALRIEPTAFGLANLIGGHAENQVTTGVVGATIGGGGDSGSANRVTDAHGTVGGGGNNQAGDNAGDVMDKNAATVGGGWSNTAGGQYSTVAGGRGNVASGWYSHVGGGWTNDAAGDFATIAGGGPSDVGNPYTTNNHVYDHYGSVVGGGNNKAGSDDADPATAVYATVGGGLWNVAEAEKATVAGGEHNTAGGTNAAVSGGRYNTASGPDAAIGGGYSNTAAGQAAAVGGGAGNEAGGNVAAVAGGMSNRAAGDYSFAAGRQAKADHDGSFVWADSTGVDFASTDNDQFIIRANGGVGINTNDPNSPLTVAGMIQSTTDGFKFPDGSVQTTAAAAADSVWSVHGNAGTLAGTNFLGTTDNMGLTLRVNNEPVFQLRPHATSPNVIGGHLTSDAGNGVYGATIGGGGYYSAINHVEDCFGTIGGGAGNQAGDMDPDPGDASFATVAGGLQNVAGGLYAAIGGGLWNYATGDSATVPGGNRNEANGDHSFAAGRRAKAEHDGAFVWADSADADFASTGVDEFSVRASGGVRLHVDAAGGGLTIEADPNSPNVIAGHNGNSVEYGAYGATISGGGEDGLSNRVYHIYGTIGGGCYNHVGSDDPNALPAPYATIAGGRGNEAQGWYAAIAGGQWNDALENGASVGGGSSNTAAAFNATIAGGCYNTANGSYAAIGGGEENDASGNSATIAGGFNNIAEGLGASITGGYYNVAPGWHATVAGGRYNEASGDYSFACGYHNQSTGDYSFAAGQSNIASGAWATVGGGDYNRVGSDDPNALPTAYATIAGGQANEAQGYHAVIAGGVGNRALEHRTFIGGGLSNTAEGDTATIAGGYLNTASGSYTAIGGGWGNTAEGFMATVAGGELNDAAGAFASVPGGEYNEARGNYSFAAGRRAKALSNGSFVWADATDADFQDGGPNTFNIRAGNGVHVSSNNNFYAGIHVTNIGDGDGVKITASADTGNSNAALYATNVGSSPAIYASCTGGEAAYLNGPVTVKGFLTKLGGGFRIDHPLDPANKYLYHNFVESPDMKNVYDGVASLDENGEAIVELPEWFEALNRDFRYQLTAMGAPGPNLYIAKEIRDNRFSIAGGEAGMKVSWQVTGIRQDAWANAKRIPVEVAKSPQQRGTYLYPEAYGLRPRVGPDDADGHERPAAEPTAMVLNTNVH